MGVMKDEAPAMGKAGLLEAIARDVRFGLRTLRRAPAFTAGVVVTFALAIGTNAAMFGLEGRRGEAVEPGVQRTGAGAVEGGLIWGMGDGRWATAGGRRNYRTAEPHFLPRVAEDAGPQRTTAKTSGNESEEGEKRSLRGAPLPASR